MDYFNPEEIREYGQRISKEIDALDELRSLCKMLSRNLAYAGATHSQIDMITDMMTESWRRLSLEKMDLEKRFGEINRSLREKGMI